MIKLNSVKRLALTSMISGALLLGTASFASAQNPNKEQRKQERLLAA